MKTKIILLTISTSLFLMGGSVTIPNTFVANTKAKASEVNANFSAVKSAVDDNFNRINTNANNIANNTNNITTNTNNIATNRANITANANAITTNASNIANSVSSITATGGLTSDRSNGDVTIKRAGGYVSVPASAFQAEDSKHCVFYKSRVLGFFTTDSTNSNCRAVAPVFLPDGATLKRLSCYIYNNDTTTNTYTLIQLNDAKVSSNLLGVGTTFLANLSNNNDFNKIQLITQEIDNKTVDNSKYYYSITYIPPKTDTSGTKQIIYSCRIEYSFE